MDKPFKREYPIKTFDILALFPVNMNLHKLNLETILPSRNRSCDINNPKDKSCDISLRY